MTGIENLALIRDQASVANIRQITDCFVSQINPLKVILFGSFADGTYTEDSDYDFYIVVNDGRNISETSYQAYKSIRDVMIRPVDIVVGTNTRFESKSRARNSLMIEGEVYKNGILLYDQAGQTGGKEAAM
jgi:predicted nucleotidyltransferase